MSFPMKNGRNPGLPPRIKAKYLALHPATIEKTFTDAVMDLKEVVVLDGIDILPDNSGCRVRSHDLHGQLPEIVVKDCGDTFLDKDQLGNQACKLVAIVRLRGQMTRWLAGGKFLPPTIVDNHATVGFKLGRKAWLAEGKDFLAAYHELHRQVVG
jgi:hypothetical protein